MKGIGAAGIALAVGTASAAVAGTNDVTPPSGAPFCIQQDHLQEYLMAALKNDKDWLAQLPDCAILKGGLHIGIIEEMPSDSTLGHVSKVRVILHGSSVVGYMLVITAQ